jgi:hypothetical protein
MADHGQGGACSRVAEGIHKAPPAGIEQVRAWSDIADCLNAIADAHGTLH